MMKNVLAFSIVLLLGFGLGYAGTSKDSLLGGVTGTKSDKPNKVVVSTTRLIQGKVVEVNDVEMALENGGDKYKISAIGNFYVNRVTVANPSDASASASKNTPPNDAKVPSTVTTFKGVKLGDQVMATLELNADGKYAVKSVNLF